MLTVEGIDFSDWLNDQTNSRGWRAVDLANAANLPSATVVRILNGDRNAGPDAAVKIAKALSLSPEHVFRQAGLLPPETNGAPSAALQELTDILRDASEADRREIIEYALWFLRRRNRRPQEPGA
ncbi:MAG TPA: helix-turn-helix transcriptional regulator [Promineifilum sp.]|nr:helix-turn-helix transcriptional regulator [Promineifilum sp.]